MFFQPIHSSRANYITFGSIDFTGSLVKDSYIEIAPTSARASASQDAGGYSESISKLSDKSATVTIQLQPQSAANQALVEVMNRDDFNGTMTISNINIITNGTVFLYDLIGCYIMEPPTETKSEDMADTANTWVFRCAELRPKSLDNTTFDQTTRDMITATVDATLDVSITL